MRERQQSNCFVGVARLECERACERETGGQSSRAPQEEFIWAMSTHFFCLMLLYLSFVVVGIEENARLLLFLFFVFFFLFLLLLDLRRQRACAVSPVPRCVLYIHVL